MSKDSQNVGLEAATVERSRNSALTELGSADDVQELKISTELVDEEVTLHGSRLFSMVEGRS